MSSASDMGTGASLPNGSPAPDPVIYDIDGEANSATTVAALHGMGYHVLCYMEVGAAETYRPDYNQFPSTALGAVMPGYSAERYLDIRNPNVVSIIKARIQTCAEKGFDAIDPDIDDSYTVSTGFPLTKAVEESYLQELSSFAHSLGLAWGLKNGDATDGFAKDLLPSTDFAVVEQCNEYQSCSAFDAYTGVKPVFEIEYALGTAQFCPANIGRGWNGVRQSINLDGGRQPCA
jgi:hypothetical protein